MPKVLFICSGNVARSQMAEAYYNHYTNSDNAISAGTLSHIPERYKALPQMIVDLMQEEGIDVSSQKPKLVTKEMVDSIDRLVIMCTKVQCPAFLMHSKKTTIYLDIEDPYGMDVDETRKIRDQIKERVLMIV